MSDILPVCETLVEQLLFTFLVLLSQSVLQQLNANLLSIHANVFSSSCCLLCYARFLFVPSAKGSLSRSRSKGSFVASLPLSHPASVTGGWIEIRPCTGLFSVDISSCTPAQSLRHFSWRVHDKQNTALTARSPLFALPCSRFLCIIFLSGVNGAPCQTLGW